jgi:HEAT repeat protein
MRNNFLAGLVTGLLLAASFGLLDAQTKPPEPGKGEPKDKGDGPLDKIGGKTLDQWIADLKSIDPSTREVALQTLPVFSSLARKAIPQIVDRLGDVDASVRVNAAIALNLVPIEDKDLKLVVDKLNTRLLTENQAIARFHLTMTAGQLGIDARPLIGPLEKVVADQTSWEIRKAAVWALSRVAAGTASTAGTPGTPPDPRAFRALIERLNHNREPSVQVRLEATIAIALLGPPLEPKDLKAVENALQERINTRNEDDGVRIWAAMAMMSMNKKIEDVYLGQIVKFFKSPKMTTRVQAIRAIGEVGKEAKGRVKDVIEMLQDPEPAVVANAMMALAAMGDGAQTAVRDLEVVAEKHKDELIRKMAKEAIKKITTKEKDKPKQ